MRALLRPSGFVMTRSQVSTGGRAPRVLVTGAMGQIGQEIIPVLRAKYGAENVIASDVRKPSPYFASSGPYLYADVTDKANMGRIVVEKQVDWVLHLAALLSVTGEMFPSKAIDINVLGSRNMLDLANEHKLRIFIPSTIAVFSPESGQDMTKDDCILNPTTVYGITKVFLEQLGAYYHRRFGVDFRSLRYPGIISDGEPGGGTTDYAVDIFHQAIKNPTTTFVCPLKKDESLPMMYMPDCLQATLDFVAAPNECLKRRTYNVAGLSFTPEMIYDKIKPFVPEYQIEYRPDHRQKIAASWPNSMDDSNARKDWGWSPRWDLDRMTEDMIASIRKRHAGH